MFKVGAYNWRIFVEDDEARMSLYRRYCKGYNTLAEAKKAGEDLFDRLLELINTSEPNFEWLGERVTDPEQYPYIDGLSFAASWENEDGSRSTHEAFVYYGEE